MADRIKQADIEQPPIEKLIRRAIAERDAKLPSALIADGLPTLLPQNVFNLARERTPPKEQEILDLDLTELSKEVSAGRLASKAVFQAYAARAVLAQQLVRRLTWAALL